MKNQEIILQDRSDAGKKLAKLLTAYKNNNTVVLGLPRGGVVVAYEIARELKAPLDIVVTRKIGAPTNDEYAIGAIGPGDVCVLDQDAITDLGVTKQQLAAIIAKEKQEMTRRIHLYRKNRPEFNANNKIVILIDDGAATGKTALAAIRFLKTMQPQKIIFACGVCAADTARILQQEVDKVVSLAYPEPFYAVGNWYASFPQTTDDQVIELLQT
jgi:predicted phosphoribosyltransferase